jgi:hypothetical protein
VADRVVTPAVAQRRADEALPTVAQLMIEVMRRVTYVGKDQQNTEGGRYNFRGIDDVVNALGPAMREVGILCLPTVEWAERQLTKTTRGKTTRETIVRIRYTFYGPRGDSISAVTEGESLDAGDKGTAKAFSVAFRIALIQGFALPTDEPDPDSFSYERGDDRDDDRARDERPSRRDRRGRDDDDRRGEDRDDRRGRNDDQWRGRPTLRDKFGDDERSDLIDTDDPEERRNQELTILKDKLRAKGLDKGAAADRFVDIFGEELPSAPAELIEAFTALIIQLGGLPEIAEDPAKQHPAVARLMAVRDAKEGVQEQMADDRDGPGGDDRWGPAPKVNR